MAKIFMARGLTGKKTDSVFFHPVLNFFCAMQNTKSSNIICQARQTIDFVPPPLPLDEKDNRFVKSFEVSESEAIKDFFYEYGFVVVRNILDEAECQVHWQESNYSPPRLRLTRPFPFFPKTLARPLLGMTLPLGTTGPLLGCQNLVNKSEPSLTHQVKLAEPRCLQNKH